MDTGYRILHEIFRILDTGCMMKYPGYMMHDKISRLQDTGFLIKYPGYDTR